MTTRRVSFGCVMYFCISPYAFLYISIRIFLYLHTNFCTCPYQICTRRRRLRRGRRKRKATKDEKKAADQDNEEGKFQMCYVFFYIHFCVSPYLIYYAQEDDDSDEGSGEQHEQDSDQREDNAEGNF